MDMKERVFVCLRFDSQTEGNASEGERDLRVPDLPDYQSPGMLVRNRVPGQSPVLLNQNLKGRCLKSEFLANVLKPR